VEAEQVEGVHLALRGPHDKKEEEHLGGDQRQDSDAPIPILRLLDSAHAFATHATAMNHDITHKLVTSGRKSPILDNDQSKLNFHQKADRARRRDAGVLGQLNMER
jgi:hypothetical protein